MHRILGFFLLLVLPSVAEAEWLAFKNGTSREIVGPWKVKGRQVIFKAIGGTLSAVRLDEVDLEASEQLSRNAAGDRGLVELKSTPTDAYDWQTYAEGTELTPIGDGLGVLTEWSIQLGQQVGVHPGSSCVPSRLVGITSGTDWWLQTGTKVAKFRPIGLSWADAAQLKTLVPNGLLCYEADAQVKSPDAAGHLAGYAILADGRDIGLELVRARAARLNNEAFSRRNAYLAASTR